MNFEDILEEELNKLQAQEVMASMNRNYPVFMGKAPRIALPIASKSVDKTDN